MSVVTPKTDTTPDALMPDVGGYRVLKEVSVSNVNGDSYIHLPDTVLSPWEVNDYLKQKIYEGSARYRSLLEPLTHGQVKDLREKATSLEGDHIADGQRVSSPWPDYVGLHPEEVISRLQQTDDLALVQQVRLYEKGGMNRHLIMEYVAPVEREPWIGYNDMAVRDVLQKFELVSPDLINEAKTYESAHRKRPAIITYEVDAPQAVEPSPELDLEPETENEPQATLPPQFSQFGTTTANQNTGDDA